MRERSSSKRLSSLWARISFHAFDSKRRVGRQREREKKKCIQIWRCTLPRECVMSLVVSHDSEFFGYVAVVGVTGTLFFVVLRHLNNERKTKNVRLRKISQYILLATRPRWWLHIRAHKIRIRVFHSALIIYVYYGIEICILNIIEIQAQRYKIIFS